jgi:membrane-associated protease RseP (regulator of RpoE activity)
MKTVFPLLLGASALILVGCSSAKPKPAPVHERGWIGGNYEVVTQFPRTFTNAPKAAVLITALNTNTPASLAGLHAGDLILEINHRSAKRLRPFYRTIDRSRPGTLLPVKIWHGGHSTERDILVGKETYNLNGIFAVGLPGFFHRPQLWPLAAPSAGFSVGVAGYRPARASKRKELTSAEERYFKSCDPKHYQPTDPGWQAWLVIMQAQTDQRVRSQEVVPAATASGPQARKATSVASLRN